MKTLILMRHGKSDWTSGMPDKNRPINGRGQLAATLMASWLEREALVPDLMLVSSATRTRETAAWMQSVWAEEPEKIFRDDLYLAEAGSILRIAKRLAQGDCILVLGHNPGMEDAVMAAGSMPRRCPMPTCALAAFAYDVPHWEDVKPGTGTLLHLIMPKSLV